MIRVDEGGEYRGETYIWCDACAPGACFPMRDNEPGIFEGRSIEELKVFLAEHEH